MDNDKADGPRGIAKIAGLLVRFHGQKAVKVAATRASHLVERGDRGGAMEWLRISETVLAMVRGTRKPADGPAKPTDPA
jgi:hypothetical protein